MRDPTGKLVTGKTRWRRFLIILGPAVAIVAVMMYLVATGALAVSIALSGTPFTLNATKLEGDKFIQFGTVTTVTSPDSVAAVTALENSKGINPSGVAGAPGHLADTITLLQGAQISGLYQTVCAPTLPGLPNLLVEIRASGTATAPSLTVQAPALKATDATFTNITIGADAQAAATAYGYGTIGTPEGMFSQAADHVTINGLTQIAVGTEAASFTLPGLTLSASFIGACP